MNENNCAPQGNPSTTAEPDYKVAARELKELYSTLGLESVVTRLPSVVELHDHLGSKYHGLTFHFVCNFRKSATSPWFTMDYSMGSGHLKMEAVDKLRHSVISHVCACAAVGGRHSDSVVCEKMIDAMRKRQHQRWLDPALWGRLMDGLAAATQLQPPLAEVIACAARDGRDALATSFEDWASEYGYDTDSRKAYATYTTCTKYGEAVKALVGLQNFNALADLHSRL